MPTTLAMLVGRRLSLLQEDARALVQAASVLGRDVALDLLTGIVDLDDVHGLLADLARRQILVNSDGDARLSFVHDKLVELTYAQIPAGHRAELHGRAAEICPYYL